MCNAIVYKLFNTIDKRIFTVEISNEGYANRFLIVAIRVRSFMAPATSFVYVSITANQESSQERHDLKLFKHQ